MELRELHDRLCEFVERMYKDETGDFDIEAMLHMVKDGQHSVTILHGGPPPVMAKFMIDEVEPDIMGLATAMWRKSPEDPSVRIGEGVLVVCESKTERLHALYEVKRDTGHIKLTKLPQAGACIPRHTLLLKETEH